MRSWLSTLDTRHDGTIDLTTLTRIFKSLDIPLSRFEVYTFFKGLYRLETGVDQQISNSHRIFTSSIFRHAALDSSEKPTVSRNARQFDLRKENIGDSLNMTLAGSSMLMPPAKLPEAPKVLTALKKRIEDMRVPPPI